MYYTSHIVANEGLVMYAVEPGFELRIIAYNTGDLIVSVQNEVIAVSTYDGFNWESDKFSDLALHIEALLNLLKRGKKCV